MTNNHKNPTMTNGKRKHLKQIYITSPEGEKLQKWGYWPFVGTWIHYGPDGVNLAILGFDDDNRVRWQIWSPKAEKQGVYGVPIMGMSRDITTAHVEGKSLMIDVIEELQKRRDALSGAN